MLGDDAEQMRWHVDLVERSTCASVSPLRRKMCAMPMMAFIGVRISWLMLARKALLARLAVSAASFAFASSAVRDKTSSSRCDDAFPVRLRTACAR